MESKILNNKGQASLEYLMTYGWAILIMSVAVIVLWQMGAFTPPATPSGTTGFSQVYPVDQKASSIDGNITITLLNDAGVKVRLKEVNITMGQPVKNCGHWPSTVGFTKDLHAGESYTVSISLSGCSSYITKGVYYRADTMIVYQNLASNIDHNSVGDCHGTVE
jgi:hypothetical protein